MHARYLLLTVQASLLLTGAIAEPSEAQAGRHLLAAAATPPSSIINKILAAGKSFNSFGQTTPQAPPAPASAFSLSTRPTALPSTSGDADLLFACRALGVQIYTGNLCGHIACKADLQRTVCCLFAMTATVLLFATFQDISCSLKVC